MHSTSIVGADAKHHESLKTVTIVLCALLVSSLTPNTFALGRGRTLVLATGEDNITSMVESRGILYVGLNVAPGGIARVDLTTMSEINRALRFSKGEDAVYSLATDGEYLYAGLYSSPGRILKIDLVNFTVESSIVLEGRNWVSCIVIHEGFLYAGLRLWPGCVVKVELNSFKVVDTLNLATGENNIYSMLIKDKYLLVNIGSSPGGAAKIDLLSFQEVASIRFPRGRDYSQALEIQGNALYVGFYDNPGAVAKIDLISFKETPDVMQFGQGEDRVWRPFGDAKFLYAGLDTRPGRIIRSTLGLQRLDSLTLEAGENGVFAFIRWKDKVLAGVYSSPGRIVELVLDLSDPPPSIINPVALAPLLAVVFTLVLLFVSRFQSRVTRMTSPGTGSP